LALVRCINRPLILAMSRDAIEQGGGTLNCHLKVCQRRDVDELSKLLIPQIAIDMVHEKTTSIERLLNAPLLNGGYQSLDAALSVFEVALERGELLAFVHRAVPRRPRGRSIPSFSRTWIQSADWRTKMTVVRLEPSNDV
jgi:hypothetical protein